MRNCIFLVLIVLGSLRAVGQDFSNKGKDFWVVFPPHQPSGGVLASLSIYITSDKASKGYIYIGSSAPIPFDVQPNSPKEYPLNRALTYISGAESANDLSPLKTVTGKGIRVVVDPDQPPVVVYAHVYAQARSAATIVLPVNVLDKKYITISYTQTQNGTALGEQAKSQFSVIATESNTKVRIQLRKNKIVFGIPYEVDLPNAGDIYTFQDDIDLSGTEIESISSGNVLCKKIAVYSGSSTLKIPAITQANSVDPLIQQCYPTNTWGLLYFVSPFKDKNNYIIRILAKEDGTLVNFKGNTYPLSKGEYYEYTESGNYLNPSASVYSVSSNKPISVSQYCFTKNQDRGVGDPEMIILNSVEQNIKDVTVFLSSKANITDQNINVVIKDEGVASFRINGNIPTSAFIKIANTGYSFLQEKFNVAANSYLGIRMTADEGFNAICYGFGDPESYGYSAGTNVKDLYQTLSSFNQYSTVNLPATCSGTPFKFVISFPYEPLSLQWVIPNYPPIPKINLPQSDSTKTINGKKVWYYSLPNFYKYDTIKTYNIRVIANNPTVEGCSGEQQIDYDLQVFERPKSTFRLQTSNCITDSLLVEDTSSVVTRPITRYMWDLGDGNFTNIKKSFKHKFDTTGKYTVRFFSITDVGCLSDTSKAELILDSVPVPDFSIKSLTCVDKDISFADSSRALGKTTLSEWNWNLGSGPPIVNTTNVSVLAKYPNIQQYTVGLKVKTANGCLSPEKRLTFSNHPNPKVSFGLPIVCLPDGKANFTDSSSISNGNSAAFSYKWIFGDPNANSSNPDTSILSSPVHRYSSIGPYNVKLIVTSGNGCVDSLTQILNSVYAQPKADFTVTPEVCLRESTQFNDLINPQGRVLKKWNWSFSNGTSDTLTNPLIKVNTPGTYTATLHGFTADGCVSDTISKSFTIHPLPTPQFRMVDPACETETVGFVQEAVANVGSIKRWNWKLGNSASSLDITDPAAVISTVFTQWGDQVISLMVENSKGCKSDTLLKTVRINPKPNVGFTLPEVCLNDAFAEFTSTTTLADKLQKLSHEWQFGDPNATNSNPDAGTGALVTHKYSAARVYTVVLKSSSSAGCISSLSQSFTVNGATPKADFTVLRSDSLCSNTSVGIQNLSTVDFGTVSKLEIYWDYLNSPTSFVSDENPSVNKIYTNLYSDFLNQASKTFTIRIRAFSGGSCVDDELKTIVVNGSPLVSLQSLQGICLEAQPRRLNEASFTDVSGIPPGFETFKGNGVSTSGIFDPALATAGTHEIIYRFTSSKGCFSETKGNIIVWPRPTADFAIANITCEKNAITFTDKSIANTGSIVSWNWIFGDGSVVRKVNNGNPQNYTYASYNTYNASLDVVTNNGCTSIPKVVAVKVNPLPIMNFTLPKVCLPEGKAVFLNNTDVPDGTGSLLTYKWTYGDTKDPSVTVAKDGLHYFSALGTYDIKLVATTSNGCIDSISKVLVDVFPQPKAGFSSLDSVCLGKDIQYLDTSSGFVRPISEWNWDFGNGATDSQKNPLYQHRASGSFLISLWVKSSEGCISDTTSKQIIIHPYPKISAGPDLFVLDDGQKQISASASGEALVYRWSPATYLSDVNILQPMVVKPQEDIVYTLNVTGRGACTSTDEILITVLKLPKPPNTFTPNGDGINDQWEIKYLDQYPGCILEVYTTQGQLVYRSVGYVNKWDGTSNGKSLPFGTYYYVIDPKSGRGKIAGYVTIIK